MICQGNRSAELIDERILAECPLLDKPVIITGTSREDLNGKVGVATDFDHAKGRYVMTLNGKDGKVVKLKPEHVQEHVPVSNRGAAEEKGGQDEADDGEGDEDDDWTADTCEEFQQEPNLAEQCGSWTLGQCDVEYKAWVGCIFNTVFAQNGVDCTIDCDAVIGTPSRPSTTRWTRRASPRTPTARRRSA